MKWENVVSKFWQKNKEIVFWLQCIVCDEWCVRMHSLILSSNHSIIEKWLKRKIRQKDFPNSGIWVRNYSSKIFSSYYSLVCWDWFTSQMRISRKRKSAVFSRCKMKWKCFVGNTWLYSRKICIIRSWVKCGKKRRKKDWNWGRRKRLWQIDFWIIHLRKWTLYKVLKINIL